MDLNTDFLDQNIFKPIGNSGDDTIIQKGNKKYSIKKMNILREIFSLSKGSHWFYEDPAFLELKGVAQILYNEEYNEEYNDNYFEGRSNDIVVAIEYMENGNLKDALNRGENPQFTSTVRCKIIFGVASIIKRIHKNNVILTDVFNSIRLNEKLEPIIEISNLSLRVKDGECGIEDEVTNVYFSGFPGFTPDKSKGHLTFLTDTFYFGSFLYIMFTNKLSFKNFCEIQSGYSDIDDVVPPFYRDLIKRCWEEDPNKRPTMDEIVNLFKTCPEAMDLGGEEVDRDEVFEYFTRIESDDLPTKENCFIDEIEEAEFHVNVGKIGEGSTSTTYKVIDKRSKIPMCKKVLKYREGSNTIKDAQNAIKEFIVLHDISHPCICRSLFLNTSATLEAVVCGQKKTMSTISLFLEFVEYPLSEVLKWNINNTLKTRIVVDIAHAMKFLHAKKMIHRDLKLENIMLNSFFETKLVDFGYVRLTECVLDGFSFVQDSLTKGIGTFAYMSPEMANEEEYTDKTDVFSFGVLLYRIFYDELPKQSIKDKSNSIKMKIADPKKPVEAACKKLISLCVEPDPFQRPSFVQILQFLREKSFMLAEDVDPSLVSKRDNELEKFEENK